MKKFFSSGAVLVLAVLLVAVPFERFFSKEFIISLNQKIMQQNIRYLQYGQDHENNETTQQNAASKDLLQVLFDFQIPLLAFSQDDNHQDTQQYMQETTIKNQYFKKEPVVLIYHTHATECYTHELGKSQSSYRSKNLEKNTCAVGDVMASVLYNEYGIEVYHDLTLHDAVSYDASYDNSAAEIKKIMEQYPSIRYIFDVHRDGVGSDESAVNKYKTTINEEKSAKVMMVVGLNYEGSEKNKAFAQALKKTADAMYPSLMLSTTIREEYRYNQFLCENAVLFEVGSNQITLEEAKTAAIYLARVLGEYIENDK